jgi:hypothetical protein
MHHVIPATHLRRDCTRVGRRRCDAGRGYASRRHLHAALGGHHLDDDNLNSGACNSGAHAAMNINTHIGCPCSLVARSVWAAKFHCALFSPPGPWLGVSHICTRPARAGPHVSRHAFMPSSSAHACRWNLLEESLVLQCLRRKGAPQRVGALAWAWPVPRLCCKGATSVTGRVNIVHGLCAADTPTLETGRSS